LLVTVRIFRGLLVSTQQKDWTGCNDTMLHFTELSHILLTCLQFFFACWPSFQLKYVRMNQLAQNVCSSNMPGECLLDTKLSYWTCTLWFWNKFPTMFIVLARLYWYVKFSTIFVLFSTIFVLIFNFFLKNKKTQKYVFSVWVAKNMLENVVTYLKMW
jgi:hypothetical protein